jgi:hypothetical protein
MDRETHASAPVVGKKLDRATFDQAETAIDLLHQTDLPLEAIHPASDSANQLEAFEQASQLDSSVKAALIRRLITQLKADQIQAILEFGQQEIAERQHPTTVSPVSENRTTCLLLKKDYTYQDRGLSEPTQYYVYLRRRKPKLDRYIGTLFYVPKGCTLSYSPDVEGRIFFNPPHNVFQLKDFKNPSVLQVVRLICLEPPPADYTFAKQQDDVPEINLRLEYLHPKTFQSLVEESYPFPLCMYEGGKLDRYRWEVSTAVLSETLSAVETIDRQLDAIEQSQQPASLQFFAPPPPTAKPSPSSPSDSKQPVVVATSNQARFTSTLASIPPSIPPSVEVDIPSQDKRDIPAKLPRRIIELPPKSSTFYLADPSDMVAILERVHLWISWSEKAMPQAKWELVQDGAVSNLRNASFKRKILSFSQDKATVTLENSLPVLVKWFQDLGLAVSQAQNQRHYSSAQLKLARSLFVEMSLPQDNPFTVLKKLFGVKFSKAGDVVKR